LPAIVSRRRSHGASDMVRVTEESSIMLRRSAGVAQLSVAMKKSPLVAS
jgi:hypothetical protein